MKIRVWKRLNGLWHWWCPHCVGGDFSHRYQAVLGGAVAHADWHRQGGMPR